MSNADDTTESTESEQMDSLTRRAFTAAAGLAAAGAAAYFTGTAEAAPAGTFPQSSDDPLLKIRADRIRYAGRTSDPSSPADGTTWYRGDL